MIVLRAYLMIGIFSGSIATLAILGALADANEKRRLSVLLVPASFLLWPILWFGIVHYTVKEIRNGLRKG